MAWWTRAAAVAVWGWALADVASAQTCTNLLDNGDFSAACAADWGGTCNVNGGSAEVDFTPNGLAQPITGLTATHRYTLSFEARRHDQGCGGIAIPATATGTVAMGGMTYNGQPFSQTFTVSGTGTQSVSYTLVATSTMGTLTFAAGPDTDETILPQLPCYLLIDNVTLERNCASEDANPCTDNYCDGTACLVSNNTASCSDGSVCTQTDQCADGVCVGSNPLTCNDSLSCTNDSCHPTNGCTYAIQPGKCRIAGTCYDDDAVRASDTCMACDADVSQIGFSTNPAKSDGSACTGSGGAGTCGGPDGSGRLFCCAGCWDGATCVGTGSQSVSACGPAGGSDCVSCDDSNPCTNDACTTGACSNTNNTASCSDGNACTGGGGADTCSNGVCVPGAPRNCNDNRDCTTDTCDPATGCIRDITTGCLINNACYAAQTPHPLQPDCMLCDPASSETAWTLRPAGTTCTAEGKAGQCLHTVYVSVISVCCTGCRDGLLCREGNADSDCGTGGVLCKDCADELACTTDTCSEFACQNTVNDGHCVIDGLCLDDGEGKPFDECLWCDPSMTPYGWSAAPDAGVECEESVDGGDGSVPIDAAADAETDAATPPDGSAAADAGKDAGKDAGTVVIPRPTVRKPKGGGCALSGDDPPAGTLAFLLAALVTAARRRNRSRKAGAASAETPQ